MDTNREYLQTKYAPDRNIETLAVAFAMHYMQQHPGTKSLCDMADVLRVSPEGLNDLIVQAGNGRTGWSSWPPSTRSDTIIF